MSKQNAVSTAIAAAVTALSLPMMPAMAQAVAEQEAPVAVEAPAPAADPAPVAAPISSETLPVVPAPALVEDPLLAPASGSMLAAPASPSMIALPASPSLIAAPAATASATPVAGPAFSLPNIKLPFSLSLSYRPETATTGGTGFAGSGALATPTQFSYPAANGAGWSGTAEIGIPFITLGARTTSYGGLGNYGAYDASSVAASLPYYWPEGAWSTYVRALGLRFGYMNEQFNAATGHQGAVGSWVGGLDSGFSLFGLIGVDYHALAGWGVSGQNVGNLATSHVPVEGDASVYVNLGPVNVRAGYVARATFTGDPASFMTIITNPASIVAAAAGGDTTTRDTVNATRLGTYMGPYFGAGFTF